jgi:hypothetical protein
MNEYSFINKENPSLSSTNATHAMQDQGGILSILLNETFLDENFMRQHAMHNSGRFLNLTISDAGCGMSHEVVERIFDPYFTTKEMGDGTGISDMTMPGSTSNGTFKFFNNRFGKGRRNRLSLFIPNHPNIVLLTKSQFCPAAVRFLPEIFKVECHTVCF